jgi:hypothetical protein
MFVAGSLQVGSQHDSAAALIVCLQQEDTCIKLDGRGMA